MKSLVSIFLVLFSFNTLAELPDVVAFVNDNPITRYDFESRKKMVIALHNIDVSDHSIESKLNSDIMNILIEGELLSQHAEKVGGIVGDAEIDNAILMIEERNKMPKNSLQKKIIGTGVNFEVFRKQIKGELIKNNIVSSLSQSISVSPSEMDIAIISSFKDFDIEAWVFTSRKGDEKAQEKMQLLKKRISDCSKVTDKLFAEFADGEKFDRKLSKLPENTQSVILDTKVGASSNVYKQGNNFKMVLVCKKEAGVSKGDLNKIESFLSNKKMSQKAAKFFKDLKVKSTIRMMIPG
jgi:hypothetical protein